MTRLLENKELDKNGFLLVKQFFEAQKIEELSKLFQDFNFSTNERFFTTHWLKNEEKQMVHEKIKHSIGKDIAFRFPESEAILYYYLVKYNDSGTIVTPHQDWTIIDNEKEKDAFTLWIPLKDTGINNGGLRVVPQSHRILTAVRGSNITMPYTRFVDEIDTLFGQNLETKKGDAVIFNHRLLHSSAANRSDSLRLAVGIVLIPKKTQCVHYYAENNKIYKYQVPSDYLLNFSFRDNPLPSFTLVVAKDQRVREYSTLDYQNDVLKLDQKEF